jgi:hypothetical protein
MYSLPDFRSLQRLVEVEMPKRFPMFGKGMQLPRRTATSTTSHSLASLINEAASSGRLSSISRLLAARLLRGSWFVTRLSPEIGVPPLVLSLYGVCLLFEYEELFVTLTLER